MFFHRRTSFALNILLNIITPLTAPLLLTVQIDKESEVRPPLLTELQAFSMHENELKRGVRTESDYETVVGEEEGECQYYAFDSFRLILIESIGGWRSHKTCFATSMAFVMMAVSHHVKIPEARDMSGNARTFFEVGEELTRRNSTRKRTTSSAPWTGRLQVSGGIDRARTSYVRPSSEQHRTKTREKLFKRF